MISVRKVCLWILENIIFLQVLTNQFFLAHLKRKLEDFIERYDGKVRLIRNKEREGLIRTRTRGAEEARGEVVLFLDAHCEVGLNWLPPLLYPIYLDRYIILFIVYFHFNF